MPEGYCVKCKAKKEIADAVEELMKNGRKAIKGKCPTCGVVMFKIPAKRSRRGGAPRPQRPPPDFQFPRFPYVSATCLRHHSAILALQIPNRRNPGSVNTRTGLDLAHECSPPAPGGQRIRGSRFSRRSQDPAHSKNIRDYIKLNFRPIRNPAPPPRHDAPFPGRRRGSEDARGGRAHHRESTRR